MFETVRLITAVAAFALTSGSVQAKPQLKTVAPKTGTLIVYRPGEYVGIVRTYAFSIDGGPRHHINAGRYMRFELPAGDHIVAHPFDITLSFGSDSQRVHISPGQTVYFQYVIHLMMGMIFEVADDQTQAKETAAGCRLQVN